MEELNFDRFIGKELKFRHSPKFSSTEEPHRTIYQCEWMLRGVKLRFRIRRLSYWLRRGQFISPVVIQMGNFRMGNGKGVIFNHSLWAGRKA